MKKYIAVATFTAVVTLTCTSGYIIIDGGPPPPPAADSPRAVLEILEYSFNERNVLRLQQSLSENFVFYVDPEEYGRRGGALPSSMSYVEFWGTAQNMFERAYDVIMIINYRAVGVPEPGEKNYSAECEVRLLVLVTENGGFLAEGSAGFEFEKYINKAGEDRWRLTKWWDHTLPEEGAVDPARPTAGMERASVAAILAYFR